MCLERQLQIKVPSDDRVRLQVYLCRALGEFETDVVLPTLVTAASPQPAWKPIAVRRSALQAIGMLVNQLGGDYDCSSRGRRCHCCWRLEAGDARSSRTTAKTSLGLRSTAVYVLGLVGGETAKQRLSELLHDPEVDIRFNAATGSGTAR